MNSQFWNIVRADIHLGESKPMEWYFIRDAKRQIVAGPFRKSLAATIAAAHNDSVMAIMDAINEAKTQRARYEGMGA